MNRKQRMSDVVINPANFATVEAMAARFASRGNKVPEEVLTWMNRAEQVYANLSPSDRYRADAELGQARYDTTQHEATMDRAVGLAEADKFFRDSTLGIAGKMEGAGAKDLKAIAENKLNVETKKTVRKTDDGATRVDPYTKKTLYDTTRKESRKYSDADSRRASLTLAFGSHMARDAADGHEVKLGDDDIASHHFESKAADNEVANAMLECDSRAATGQPLPTSPSRGALGNDS